jgi:restriction endonuclease S subunit
MIPATWQKANIGELCQIVKGHAPIMKTKPGMYPLVTMGEEHKTADHYQLDTEAVCVPMISSFGHGKPGLKRVHYVTGKFALSNLLTALIVKDPSQLSTHYLSLYLNTFKDQLIVPLQTGAANMSLRPEKLASVPVRFPPFAEQERIVHLTDEIETLRRLRIQAMERTADLASAIFYEMFGDIENNSRNWKKIPLTKLVLEMQPGFAQRPDSMYKGVQQIRPLNITTDGLITLDGTKSIPCTDMQLRKYGLKKNDVIFNNTNSPELVGKTALFELEGIFVFSNHMTRIRPDTKYLEPQYLAVYLHLLWKIGYFKRLCTQWINQAAINKNALGKTLIAVPPLTLQQKFLTHIANVRMFESYQGESASKLELLYSSILAKVFGGVL